MKGILYLKILACISAFIPISNRNHVAIRVYNRTCLELCNNSSDIKTAPDLVEQYSNWFGFFPPSQKWKSVRFTIYSVFSGYLLSEGINNVRSYIEMSKLNI